VRHETVKGGGRWVPGQRTNVGLEVNIAEVNTTGKKLGKVRQRPVAGGSAENTLATQAHAPKRQNTNVCQRHQLTGRTGTALKDCVVAQVATMQLLGSPSHLCTAVHSGCWLYRNSQGGLSLALFAVAAAENRAPNPHRVFGADCAQSSTHRTREAIKIKVHDKN